MTTPSPQQVTQLLVAWNNGDKAALDELIPLVHEELHRLAHHYMSRERAGHMLQTTALVNEAYVRLIDWRACPAASAVTAQVLTTTASPTPARAAALRITSDS